MSNSKYPDPILERIYDLLVENGPRELKKKYVVSQVLFNPVKADLPVCFISNLSTISVAEESGGGLDSQEDTKRIRLTLMTDWTGGNKWQGFASRQVDLIEGRDENYILKPDSLLGVLILNRDLGDNLFINLDGQFEVTYPEPEALDNTEGFMLAATVDFEVTI